MPETSTIQDLLERISNDDYLAFSRFYDMYYNKISSFSRLFLKSDVEVKETVADVFYYSWLNRKKLFTIANIEGYLYTSVKNQALKHKKYNERFQMEPIEGNLPDVYIETDSPENIVMNDELRRIIEKAVNELPPRCKVIFLMIRERGLKYKEVADLLSISERTVQGQMIIATKKIISTICGYYPQITRGNALLLLFLSFSKKKLSLL